MSLAMDANLYKAAVEGKIKVFNDYKGRLDSLFTKNQNTVLHVHLANRTHKHVKTFHIFHLIAFRFPFPTSVSTEFVQHLLNECPSFLLQANVKGEIPLHIEARYGHRPTVELLIERAKLAQPEDLENGVEAVKEMLRKRDYEEQNTPLHNAVRCGHLDVVLEIIKADPDFIYPPNKIGETPLFIAARRLSEVPLYFRRYRSLLAMILDKSKSPAHGGPYGRTVLHAAAMAGDAISTKIILKKKEGLTKETDENGQTPLHYAAHLGHYSVVKELLEWDESAAYLPDKKWEMTPLLMAARQGHVPIIREIISCCPDSCEIVDKRGWNLFHFLARFPLEYMYFHEKLIADHKNQKDARGITPRQVSLTYKHGRLTNKKGPLKITKKKEQIVKLLEDIEKDEVAEVPVKPTRHELHSGSISSIEKAKESQLVVAALIATVTFAAAITVPGGYKSEKGPDQGTPFLIHKAAFIVFVISDALAFVFSLTAVILHFQMAFPFLRMKRNAFVAAFDFIIWALYSLVIAFCTGTYAVLQPSLWLAITSCCIGLGTGFFVSRGSGLI